MKNNSQLGEIGVLARVVFDLPELYAVSGALASEVAREMDLPGGLERTDYGFLVSAYRKVQAECDVHYEPKCRCGAPLRETGTWMGQPVFSCPACHGAEAS